MDCNRTQKKKNTLMRSCLSPHTFNSLIGELNRVIQAKNTSAWFFLSLLLVYCSSHSDRDTTRWSVTTIGMWDIWRPPIDFRMWRPPNVLANYETSSCCDLVGNHRSRTQRTTEMCVGESHTRQCVNEYTYIYLQKSIELGNAKCVCVCVDNRK